MGAKMDTQTAQPHRNIGFEATSIAYDSIRKAWVVRGFSECWDGLVVTEDVMRDAEIEWPEGCERIELNTANLMAVYDPRDRDKGIIEFEELRNSREWEAGFDEIPY